MKAVVVYSSKTGFTKKYAQWIAEELSADIFEASKVNIKMLDSYDAVIYGGSLYATGIRGVKLITKNLNKLKGKMLAVFAVGVSPARQEVIDDVSRMNFPKDTRECIRFFYFRGGFDYKSLPLKDKLLMTLLRKRVEGKKKREGQLTPDEAGMLAVYEKPADFTSRKNIEELVSYVKLHKSRK